MKVFIGGFLTSPFVDFDLDGRNLAHLLAEEVLSKSNLSEEELDEALFFGLTPEEVAWAFPHRVPAFGIGNSTMEVAHQFISVAELMRAGRAGLALLVGVRPSAPAGAVEGARGLMIEAKAMNLTRARLDEAVLQSLHRYAGFMSRVEFLDALQPFCLPEKEWQLVAEDRLPLAGVTPEQLSLQSSLSAEIWDFLTASHFAPVSRGGCACLLMNEEAAARHPFPHLVEVGDMRFLSVHGRGDETGLFPAASLCEPGEAADAVFTSAGTAVESAAFDLRFRAAGRDFGLLLAAQCERVNPWGSELAYGTGAGCGLLRRAGFLAAYLAGEDKKRGLVLENLSATAGVQMEFLLP